MCGISGIFRFDGRDLQALVENMTSRLAHRGPDGVGTWVSLEDGIALGHRRLSIVDLSDNGRQPMLSKCGRYVIVFNGEIYNHNSIRQKLLIEGDHQWRGSSDTEVLLSAIVKWGMRECLKEINGMFAFALWDREKKTLTLARDRTGEKPLYYGIIENNFVFSSEIKAFYALKEWQKTINQNALTKFIQLGYVPAPLSIYENIYKLKPANFIEINEYGKCINNPVCYWDLVDIAKNNIKNRCKHIGSEVDNINYLNEIISNSVSIRRIADVPLGAFLSGGIDSTVVVAHMQAQSMVPIKTFSIGFSQPQYNEAPHARRVAEYLKTDHSDLILTDDDARRIAPAISGIYDEPFADSSQIPTLFISEMARNSVKVCLSGDGGDEVFGGYNRYAIGYSIWKSLSRLPYPIRKLFFYMVKMLDEIGTSRLLSNSTTAKKNFISSDRIAKFLELLNHNDEKYFYESLVSQIIAPEKYLLNSVSKIHDIADKQIEFKDFRDYMMLCDTLTYLPDDILTKVDRASMSVGLEIRAPLLDHRLIEFAWSIPMRHKINGNQGKWILRKVLDRYVPRTLVDRPKMGFGVPLEHWLRGPLRDWAEALLSEKSLASDGFFKPSHVRNMWTEHSLGIRNWHYPLWNILMFNSWLHSKR